ncbi:MULTISPECIES: dihydrofolate reductase [unclassified Oscillibacter]|uniref:dihydrofolate reductase n=1 Tax=unclassified Oscillibacter TaxID=2629304 RepID=UPI0025EB087A|nr:MULTISPECIES: dihydrofolate reductase [unclassified Oscillibacter]
MNAILSVAQDWGIGKDNQLLFYLKEDMKRFRALTSGGTVIMGRRTLETLPGGNPLPNRRNIVITHDKEFTREGAEIVHSVEAAVNLVDMSADDVWVMGGGSIYAAMLSRCKMVYLTRVEAVIPGTDTFFPNLDKLAAWKVASQSEPIEEDGLTYRYVEYLNLNL